LQQAGHGVLAYLGDVERTAPQDDRLAAFDVHARRLSLRGGQPRLLTPASLGPELLHTLIDSGVTAVVVESHELADVLTQVAARAGVSVPGALSLVCLDVGTRLPGAQGWSHIVVPRRQLGRRAVAVLIELLDGNIPPDYHELLPVMPATSATITAPDPVRTSARPGKAGAPARRRSVKTPGAGA